VRLKVTAGIVAYRLSRPHRFGGNVYCSTHQREPRAYL
jgi:hypothetical protein